MSSSSFLWLSPPVSARAPLLGVGDTPLPDAFHLLPLDEASRPKTGGDSSAMAVERVGANYRAVDRITTRLVTFRMWDSATRTYAAQIVDQKSTTAPGIGILYGLAAVDGDVLTLYLPNLADKELMTVLAQSGVEKQDASFSFSSEQQLFDALGLFSHRLKGAVVNRFRIYRDPDQNAAFEADLAIAGKPEARAPSAAPTRAADTAPPPAPPRDLADVTPVIDPKQLVQDAGADVPNSCDVQAAHPKDPFRMSTGVASDDIVPRLAQQECERAVAKFPNTIRFRYQLGRALSAARDDQGARALYEEAAGRGYPAAFYSLAGLYGPGAGAPVDADMAQMLLRKAIAGGVDAQKDIGKVVFVSEGYANPQVMQAVYDRRLTAQAMSAQSAYWLTFLDKFRSADPCARLLTDETFSKVYLAAQIGEIKGVFGALGEAHRGQPSGNLDDAARSGWDAGMNMVQGMVASVSRAKQDAQLFYDRHGCDSPVAYRFFNAIAAVAQRM